MRVIVRNSPLRPLWHALAALAATLLLGTNGAPLHGAAGLLSWGMFGLVLVSGAGLLAWHLAQLTVLPLPRGGLAVGALPAALVPLLVLPQIGAGALLVPLALAIRGAVRDSAQRPAALALTCAPLCADSAAMLTLLLGASLCLSLRAAHASAANDNPALGRGARFWRMPLVPSYAILSPASRASITGE